MDISEIINLYGPLTWPNYIVIPLTLLLFFGAWYMEIYNLNKGCEWDKFEEKQDQVHEPVGLTKEEFKLKMEELKRNKDES